MREIGRMRIFSGFDTTSVAQKAVEFIPILSHFCPTFVPLLSHFFLTPPLSSDLTAFSSSVLPFGQATFPKGEGYGVRSY